MLDSTTLIYTNTYALELAMSEPFTRRLGLFAKFWRRLGQQFGADVPLDIALCEYDCRKPQCLQGEWADCQRRLRFIEKTKALAAAK